MKKLLLVISIINLLLFCSTVAVEAQSDAAERRYRAGIQLIREGNYEKAKQELAPLTERSGGGVVPYAYFYHALADFKLKNYTGTQLVIRQLLERFPDWEKRNDAYYLQAASYLERKEYDKGLESLSQIIEASASLKADIAKLESFHFSQITDVRYLKSLQRDFPNNRGLALALIDQIQKTSSDKADLELSDRLTNRFGIPAATVVRKTVIVEPDAPRDAANLPTERNRNRGYFNIGILFPFRVNELASTERARTNQYALDLYNGMKLAKTKLQSEGITVNLFAYDVDNDTTKMNEILNNPSFIQNDLLFGPLYAEPNRLATEFATQNRMVLVNPISTSGELIANQPMAFLAQPSLNQQALQTLNFAQSLGTGKKAAVYYGNNRKDSTLAATYLVELKRAGFQLIEAKKLVADTEIIKLTEINTPGHVFLACSNEAIGPKLLKTLSARKVAAPVIATASAFDFNKAPLSTFTRSELYLVSPDFVDNQRSEVEAFNNEYLEQRNLIPSVYAYQGYDMVLFFGRMMARNRGQLPGRSQLKSDGQTDYLISGFNYTTSNENQVVPIVKFEEGRFVIVNK
ncbi:ABC transporter substrate-binding protein [Tellurirhabdus bombi]|uniref:ABC transporter substrate-binding protein n=1 Tax=Tellurirhabdus bombi TaxID=2907205 RepID=UPI001F39B45D|nr:ABC transporter substrate-binding protein [Tellurirhabdus bombi]